MSIERVIWPVVEGAVQRAATADGPISPQIAGRWGDSIRDEKTNPRRGDVLVTADSMDVTAFEDAASTVNGRTRR